jgi:hypothetical protein
MFENRAGISQHVDPEWKLLQIVCIYQLLLFSLGCELHRPTENDILLPICQLIHSTNICQVFTMPQVLSRSVETLEKKIF